VLAAVTGAHAAAPSGPGAVCQFSSLADPTAEGDVQTGQISGGPLVTVDVDTASPQSGTLHCYIQVNNDIPTGSGPGVSGHGTGVVTAGPAQVSYTATETDNTYLCSTWTDDGDGVTYYFDDTTSDFTTTPVPCSLATSANAGPPPRTYPTGRIHLSGSSFPEVSGMTIEYDWASFDPPLYQWTCVEGSDSVTCTPPPTSHGPDRAACGTVTVDVAGSGVGIAAGLSYCSAGAPAQANSATHPHDAQRSDSPLPWTCQAPEDGFIGFWYVDCTVGP
jgi:hypothetical protein